MIPTFQGQQFAACPRQLLKELKYSSIHAFFQLHFNDAGGIGKRGRGPGKHIYLMGGGGGGEGHIIYLIKWEAGVPP